MYNLYADYLMLLMRADAVRFRTEISVFFCGGPDKFWA